MKKLSHYSFFITCLFLIILSGTAIATESLYDIAYQTCVYAYPLVLTKATQLSQNILDNHFVHFRKLPSPSNRDIVRPNRDTMYSIAWLNLNKGPILLTVPETIDRYYLVQIMDMWTDTFAGPSSRTTGSEGGRFLIVGPNWDGQLPETTSPEIKELINDFRLIKSPTNQVWIMVRIEAGSEAEYPIVQKIQDGYQLEQIGIPKDQSSQILSNPRKDPRFLKITQAIEKGAVTPPQVIEQMDAATFFEIFTELMIENPPHIQDWPIVALMSQIGIIPGKALHFESLDENVQNALNQAVQDALKDIHVQTPIPFKDYWRFMPMFTGSYGANYMFRAAIAFTGLGANLPEDAVYPVTNIDCNSEILDGSKNYVVHFEKDQIPPTYAFWSLTVYDPEIYLIENPIHRYNLTSRQNVMKLNPDGSLDIYLQDSSPGVEWESNWLPIPSDEPFSITLRIYWPKREVLEGIWKLPKVCPR